MRADPQVKALDAMISSTNYNGSDQWILLDSGATHALRPATSMEEWSEAVKIKVTLANGTTDSLKIKPQTKILLTEPVKEGWKETWILPMGGLADMGFQVKWKSGQCEVADEDGKLLEVDLQGGCPMIKKDEGLRIFQRLENFQLGSAMKMMNVYELLGSSSVREGSCGVDVVLTAKMKEIFPSIPDAVAMRVFPLVDGLLEQGFGTHLPGIEPNVEELPRQRMW